MEHHITQMFIVVGALGMMAQWLAWRFSIPAIVLLALAGVVVGPGLGWLNPSEDFGALLQPMVKIGVAIILFEGGLNLKWHELKEAGAAVRRLTTAGVVLSWVFGTAAAHWIGGLSWPVALVFGAIVVVTGPTVIMPLLRHARLKRRPASLLKWEGIVNDPTGALLAVLVFEYFAVSHAGTTLTEETLRLGWVVAVTGLLGFASAWLLGQSYRRGWVPEFLKPPIVFGAVLVVYALANQVQEEAGLLAATVFGVTLGNMRLPSIEEMRRFKEYVTILLVSGVFILLSADLDTEVLAQLDWRSAALLATVLFLVRPVSILLATIGIGMDWRERALVAWIAPRGIVAAAVAGVFAAPMAASGYEDAPLLVPLIFSLVFLTVTLHGFSIGWLARRFGLASAQRNGVIIAGASLWGTALGQVLKDLKVPVLVVDASWHRLRSARLAGLRVHYGELLSELAEQSLELNDIGYLLAATDNDAYNALVCTRFGAELGRNRVFQLPLIAADENDPKGLSHTLRGAIAFGEDMTYEELLQRYYHGWRFQKTRITGSYKYEDFLQERGKDAVEIMLVRPDGGVTFSSPKQRLKPKADDVVISYLPPGALRRKAGPEPAPVGKTEAAAEPGAHTGGA